MWAFLFLQVLCALALFKPCGSVTLSISLCVVEVVKTRQPGCCLSVETGSACVCVWQGPSACYFSSLPLMITSVSAVRRLCGRERARARRAVSRVLFNSWLVPPRKMHYIHLQHGCNRPCISSQGEEHGTETDFRAFGFSLLVVALAGSVCSVLTWPLAVPLMQCSSSNSSRDGPVRNWSARGSCHVSNTLPSVKLPHPQTNLPFL